MYAFLDSVTFMPPEAIREFYNKEYVRRHSLDAEKGIGKIFLRSGSKLMELPSSDSMAWNPKHKYKKDILNKDIVIQTLEYQMHLWEFGPSLDPSLSPENKRYWQQIRQQCQRMNRKWIEITEKKYQEDSASTNKFS